MDNSNLIDKNKSDRYSSQKSVSQNLLNTSIIQSNLGVIIFIFSENVWTGFEYTAIILSFSSLALQILMFFIITWLIYIRQEYSNRLVSAERVNLCVTIFSGITLVINLAITTLITKIRN